MGGKNTSASHTSVNVLCSLSSYSTDILEELKLQGIKIHNGFVLSRYSRGKCFANDIVFIAKAQDPL